MTTRTRASRRLVAAACLIALALLAGCIRPVGPRAEFTATPEADYPPLDVTFDATASSSPNGIVVSYNWDFGDGETGTGATITHRYEEKGTYTVTLEITDSSGKTAARSDQVTALNRVPVAAFSVDKYWVGVQDPLTFDASASYDPDGTIVSYVWSFGDGTIGEGMIVQHEYTTAGGTGWKPQVTLTVTDEDGGSGSRSQQVNVVGCDSCGG